MLVVRRSKIAAPYWFQRLYPARNIRIYNFSYPGATTAAVREEFARRLHDGPDVMVVITGHNEFLFPDPKSERTASIRERLAGHLATVRLVSQCLHAFRRVQKA